MEWEQITTKSNIRSKMCTEMRKILQENQMKLCCFWWKFTRRKSQHTSRSLVGLNTWFILKSDKFIASHNDSRRLSNWLHPLIRGTRIYTDTWPVAPTNEAHNLSPGAIDIESMCLNRKQTSDRTQTGQIGSEASVVRSSHHSEI